MSTFNLHEAARRVMLASGFPVAFGPEIESALIHNPPVSAAVVSPGIVDLRHLLWSSVDNTESRDLDQVEVADVHADGTVRLLVGIADVDALVPQGSALDQAAAERTTTVYTGIQTFPMLPPVLSEGLTSLNQNEDRLAVVTELNVAADGTVLNANVYRALVRNHAKLAYEGVGHWLAGDGPAPTSVAQLPGLAAQVRAQDILSGHLHEIRRVAGALEFDTVEAQPVIRDGQVVDLTVTARTRARTLIENFMVAANTAVSAFLRSHQFPSIQRIVRKPARWDRIMESAATFGTTLPAEPNANALSDFLTARKAADFDHFPDLSLSVVKLLGPGEYTVIAPGAEMGEHFGLAVHGYTHSTAPNRRYVDLVTQRLLKAACSGTPCPYTVDELTEIAAHCNARAQMAQKVERMLHKAAAAVVLQNRIGDVFPALVTGVKPHATFVRVIKPPVEGRVMRGEAGLDVGDHLRVRLLSVDPEQGFIDFERVG